MKTINYYILAIMSLVIFSCTGSDDEPATVEWSEGKAPLALRALEPQQSRADDFTTRYDLYTGVVYYDGPKKTIGYYSKSKRDTLIFRPMTYMELPGNKKFYCMDGYFYPISGKVKLLSFGVPTGKHINSTPCPKTPDKDNLENTEMVLVLNNDYDGSFEVIAADSLKVLCNPDLKQEILPFAHFHFIQAHINFKFKWAEGVAADAGIRSRLKINSVRIENTPCQGDFYVREKVADGVWKNLGPDAVLAKTPKAIPNSGELNFGGIYVVPQENRQRIVVNYTIQNGSGDAAKDKKTMNYVVQDKTENITEGWLRGHKYTYVIKIGESGSFSINQIEIQNNPFKEDHVGTTIIK